MRGNELSNWLHERLVDEAMKVTWNDAALQQARAALAAEVDISQLRKAAEGLAMLGAFLQTQLKQPKLGEAVLLLVVELGPRFDAVIGQKRVARMEAKVEAAVGSAERLGQNTTAAKVPEGAGPPLSWKDFRGPFRG